MEHLKRRIQEIFCKVEKEMIFRSLKHRKDFCSLLMRHGAWVGQNLYRAACRPVPAACLARSVRRSRKDHKK